MLVSCLPIQETASITWFTLLTEPILLCNSPGSLVWPKIRHTQTHFGIVASTILKCEILLHSGNFSIVKLGINKESQERCAVKIIDKSLVKNKPEMLTNEVDILLRVKHPGIIGLLDLFDTPEKMMLCMELCVNLIYVRPH